MINRLGVLLFTLLASATQAAPAAAPARRAAVLELRNKLLPAERSEIPGAVSSDFGGPPVRLVAFAGLAYTLGP